MPVGTALGPVEPISYTLTFSSCTAELLYAQSCSDALMNCCIWRLLLRCPSTLHDHHCIVVLSRSFYFSLGARGPADSVKHLVKQTVYARSDLLNLRAMCEALSVVVGTHDFRFLSSAARTQSASGAGRSPSPSAVQETSPTHVVGLDDTGAASLLSPLDSTPATAGAGSESEADEDAPVSSGLGRNARNTANQKTVRTISSASLALLSASEVDLTLSPLLSGDGHCLYQYSAPPANSGTPSALEISSGSGGEHNYDGLAAVTPELVEQRPILRLKVTGDGFLMHMVRKIAAATLMVGKGRLTVADLTRLMATADALAQQEQLAGTFGDAASLRASRMMYMHLSQSIVAASGKGLYLEDIALPPTFWTDLDFCNNETPGYAEEYCLPLTAR